MKFAPIVPIEYDPASVSDFHLILAHQVLEDKSYREYYQSHPDHHIILDNSVVELGDAVSVEMLEEAHSYFPDSWLAVPDKIGDGSTTVRLGLDFYFRFKKPAKLMLIPQGKNLDEWMACLRDLLDIYYPKYYHLCIGIPRAFEDLVGSRRIAYLNASEIWDGPYHLLGVQHNIQEVLWAKNNPNVWGVDSSLPVRAALARVPSDKVIDLRKLPDVTEYIGSISLETREEITRIYEVLKPDAIPQGVS